MTQDNVSDKLGLTAECKRRTMTRYEKGNIKPKFDRTLEIAQILNISVNAIKNILSCFNYYFLCNCLNKKSL